MATFARNIPGWLPPRRSAGVRGWRL